MADLQKDLLGLQYSPDFDITGMQEADVNLVLSDAVAGTATIFGKVSDESAAVEDAIVKVFDQSGKPYFHTLTDAAGDYTVDNLPAGTYSVAAVKEGYRLSVAQSVTLSASDTAELDFIIAQDTTLSLGAIAGVLTTTAQDSTITPLAGAKMTLMNSEKQDVAVTYTADDGEFAFYDVDARSYFVVAALTGYMPSTPTSVTVQQGSILNIAMSLTVDTKTYNGTVSGIIKDSKGNVVAGAFVGLYQITVGSGDKEVETLVSITKTNAAGQYLIGDLTEGKYVVKAKLNQ